MKRAALIAFSLLALPAAAQTARDEVMDGAERCAGIADDRSWLDCFYGSAQPMRARLGLSPAPQSQTRLVPPVGAGYTAAAASPRRGAPQPKEKGFFAELLGSTRPVATNMPAASYTFDRDGRFTVKLANGQTYQQSESDVARADWRGPPGNLLVTVQNSGDTYTIKVKGEPGTVYRARRR